MFNQEIIPNTLRTKLIPALEEEENKLNQAARDIQQLKTSDVNYFSNILYRKMTRQKTLYNLRNRSKKRSMKRLN